ncbi:MAG: TetR/AcrR family transcriptional regulator [Bryobacterales bacterium]|nr:TetR/AcrR family transcriptional regulator [Bryobacterales bacterium]
MSLLQTTTKPTRERILDAAEALFATRGFRGTPLKEITELADVNIAAVNYHFRSKDALVLAVYERCFHPLNEERMLLLNQAEAAAAGAILTLEQVLNALFEPMMRTWQTNRNFILLVGRLQSEPDSQLDLFIRNLYAAMIQRFLDAAHRAAPDVSEADLFFWIHFLFGGVVYSLINSQDVGKRYPGQSLSETPDAFLSNLISFGTAGLRSRSPLKSSRS